MFQVKTTWWKQHLHRLSTSTYLLPETFRPKCASLTSVPGSTVAVPPSTLLEPPPPTCMGVHRQLGLASWSKNSMITKAPFQLCTAGESNMCCMSRETRLSRGTSTQLRVFVVILMTSQVYCSSPQTRREYEAEDPLHRAPLFPDSLAHCQNILHWQLPANSHQLSSAQWPQEASL